MDRALMKDLDQHKYPLMQALSYGAGSIEADVHLVNGTLLIGHDPSDLSPEKTLNALYLKKLLDAANDGNEGRMKGLWEVAPYMPLHLLIDIKTEGPASVLSLVFYTHEFNHSNHMLEHSTLYTKPSHLSVKQVTSPPGPPLHPTPLSPPQN
jgi:hypothetical protein